MLLIQKYIFLFLIFSIFAFFDSGVKNHTIFYKVFFGISFFFLIIFVALRDGNYLNDYLSYFYIYFFNDVKVEPSFVILRNLFYNNLGSPYRSFSYFMIFFAFISLLIKAIDIKRFSNYLFFSVLIYISDLLLLHEFTQIRAGVACGITIYSIRYAYERKPVKFIFCTLIGISFHVSAVVGFIFYFLKKDSINKKLWITILLASFFLPAIHFSPFALGRLIPISYIQRKLYAYTVLGGKANTFTILSISKTFLVLYLLSKDKLAYSKNKYFYLLVKIQIISIISVGFFSANQTAAVRFSEFLSCTGFLLFPIIIDMTKEKSLAKIGLILISLLWVSLRLFKYGMISTNQGAINGLLNPISNLQW